MASVDARLTRLIEALERCKMEQDEPMDDLSRSLFDHEAWLLSLDEQGKREFLEALNSEGLGLQMEDVEAMIQEARL